MWRGSCSTPVSGGGVGRVLLLSLFSPLHPRPPLQKLAEFNVFFDPESALEASIGQVTLFPLDVTNTIRLERAHLWDEPNGLMRRAGWEDAADHSTLAYHLSQVMMFSSRSREPHTGPAPTPKLTPHRQQTDPTLTHAVPFVGIRTTPQWYEWGANASLRFRQTRGARAMVMHDTSVVGYLLYPQLFLLRRVRVDVLLEGAARGATVVDRRVGLSRATANALVAEEADAEMLVALLMQDLAELLGS